MTDAMRDQFKVTAIGQMVQYIYMPFPSEGLPQLCARLNINQDCTKIGGTFLAPNGVSLKQFSEVSNDLYPSAKMECRWGGDVTTTLKNARLIAPNLEYGLVADIPNSNVGEEALRFLRSHQIMLNADVVDKNHVLAPCVILTDPKSAERTVILFEGSPMEKTVISPRVLQQSNVLLVTAYLVNSFDLGLLTDFITENINPDTKTIFNLASTSCIKGRNKLFQKIVPRYDVVVGNEGEFMFLYEREKLDDAIDAHHANIANAGTTTTYVTLADQGVLVLGSDKSVKHIEGVKGVNVADTSSAGDTFLAGVIIGSLYNLAPEICARIGNKVAADVISKFGSDLSKKREILTEDLWAELVRVKAINPESIPA